MNLTKAAVRAAGEAPSMGVRRLPPIHPVNLLTFFDGQQTGAGDILHSLVRRRMDRTAKSHLAAALAVPIAATMWWRAWLYSGAPGPPGYLHRFIAADGKGAYDVAWLEMALILGAIYLIVGSIMKKVSLRILALCLGISVLTLGGYLAGSWGRIPEVETWTREESVAEMGAPSERAIMRQIRALTERNPIGAARSVWDREDPWLYGVRSKSGLTVPGIPNDSPVLMEGMLPVRAIAWSGGTTGGDWAKVLDHVAVKYAEAYNVETVLILGTN